MAASTLSFIYLAPPPTLLAARSSARPHMPPSLALPLCLNPISQPKSVFSSSYLPWRSFRASLKVAQSDTEKINGDERHEIQENEYEKEVDQKELKTLIQAYKKAILGGDTKSVEEIEAAICSLDNEKNDLAEKFAEITAEIASEKDKFLRLKADFENFRKQTEKDRLNFTSDIQGDVIESLLPMVDSFETTKKEVKPESEQEEKIETSYQGIYKQFVEVMRSLRVAVVETVGKPFDPAIHEAVAREESHQYKAGIVSQEIQRGFVLGNRLLRMAKVKVSTGQGQVKVASATEKPEVQQEVVDEPAVDSED